MKRSLEQLRSQSWPDHASAVKELKRNGFGVRGADYELRESDTGTWHIMELEAEAAPPAKAAKTTRPAAKAKAPAPKAKTTKAKQDPPPAEPEPTPEPVAETPALPPGANLTALETNGGPYTLVVLAEHVMQNSAVAQAYTIAKHLGVPCQVMREGVLVRMVDHAAVMAAKKASRSSGGGRAPGRKRDLNAQPNPTVAKAIAMARRAEGVTREQLRAVSPKQQPWTAILKDAAERWGYGYRTTDAPADSKSRTVSVQVIGPTPRPQQTAPAHSGSRNAA